MTSSPWFASGRSRAGRAALRSESAHATRLERVVDWLALRHRRLCLVAVLALTLALGLRLPELRIDPSIDKTFPRQDERLADYEQLRDTFGSDEDTALCVLELPGSVLERDALARIDELTLALERSPLVDAERLTSLTKATFARVDEEGELDIGPLYTPERHAGWDAAEVDRLLRGHPAFEQRLISKDRRLAGFWIPMAPGDSSEETRRRFVSGLRGFFSQEGMLEAGEVAHLEGFAVARDTVLGMIVEDSWSLFPLAFVALLIVLAGLFRQVVAPLLALLVIACSIVWTLGGMAWADIPLNTLSACIPVLVLVASVGDVVHLLTRYHSYAGEGASKESAIARAVHHVAGPCLLTSLTTAAGFASLGLSQVELLSEFGLPVAAGVVAAYLITLGAVPTLLTWLPAPAARVRQSGGSRFTERVVHLATRRPLAVVAGTIGLCALSVAALPWLSRDARLSDDLDQESTLVQTQRLLEERFGGAASLEVVIDTHQAGGALRPEVQAAVLELTRELRTASFQEQGVLSALSLPDFLRDAFHTWNQRAPEFDRLPDTPEALAQLHFLYWFADQDPTKDLVDTQTDPSQLRVRVRTGNLYTSEFFALVEGIEAAARERLPEDVEVRITGSTYMGRLVTESLVSEMLGSAGLAIFVVGLMVWFFFRSLRLAALSVLCSALPLLVVLAVMSATGTTLTLSTSIVFALAFGICVDDTVHMVAAYAQRRAAGDPRALEGALRETTRALVLSTVALLLGFSVLGASNFPANRTFAWLLSVTLVFALVADLLFLPALLRLFAGSATRRRPRAALSWSADVRQDAVLSALLALQARGVRLPTSASDAAAWRALADALRNRAPPDHSLRNRAPP